jgi:transglutaminase-like putative cysteine protease
MFARIGVIPAGIMKLIAFSTLHRPMSRDKADTLLLLTACALVIFPHAGHLPIWTTILSIVLLAWRGWITFRGNRMPQRWLLLPIAAVIMGGVYWSYHTFFGRDAGVAMLTLLLSLKLLEMRAKRDLFSVVLVAFFLILTNFFYSQSIGTALMMILAIVAILATQLSFQYTGAVPSLRKRLRLSVMIVALAAPLTLILFVLFPRIQGPLWGLPSDANAGHTGMSDSMAPGNISRLANSSDIAFQAKFLDAIPSKSQLYWRGIVLDHYDGRTWTRQQHDMLPRGPVAIQVHGAPVRYQVTMEPSGQHWLFALDIPQGAPYLAGNPSRLTDDLQIVAGHPINDRIRYDAASYVDFNWQANEPDSALRDWLALPEGYNPRTLQFAVQLRRQSNDDVQLINTVLRFFRTEGFRYTMEPPPLGKHAVDEFLFDTRAGFCEHYSGAFVVLMRALGIPARVVTGYQGGELNPVDGFMIVRQSDAHAWAEVWLKNRGWTRIDPTAAVAPDRIEQNLGSAIPSSLFGGLIDSDIDHHSWLSKLRWNWDAATNAWNQWILNYTPERQRQLLKALGFAKPDWRTMVLLMVGLATLLTAGIAYWLVMQRPKKDPVSAIYETFCNAMARQGIARAIYEGPHTYGIRLTAATSPLSSAKKMAVSRFLQLYESLQYGRVDKVILSAKISQLKTLFSQCR